MSDDPFIRALQGAGLVHDVDLFLAQFRCAPGEYRLAIVADGCDAAMSAEAMVPALRYLAREGIGVVLLSGIVDRRDDGVASFAERLHEIGAIDRTLEIDPDADWRRSLPHTRGAVVSLDLTHPADAPTITDRLCEIGCRKIMILDAQGILFREDRPEGIVALPAGASAEAWLGGVDERQRPAARFALAMADEADARGVSVSLASPINMMAELFTVRGAGTFFRPAASFVRFGASDAACEQQLRDVIARSFDRALLRRDFFAVPGTRAILEAQGRAAALLVPTPFGDYMSKFAVAREAQGTGIGADLWGEILGLADGLFWRARQENPINSWYARVADGMMREGDWVFYWRGLSHAQAEAAKRHALGQPEDFGPAV